MSRVGPHLIVFACVLALAISSVPAQDVTGSITGEVKDVSGALVPGAIVTARHSGTSASFTSKTDETGTYWLRNLPVGTYDVSAEAKGFSRYRTADLRLQVNEVVRLDVALAVGTSTESVTVGAQAVNVDTTSGVLKEVIDEKRIENLPLNGRNAAQLMQLVAGVYIYETVGWVGEVTSPSTYPGTTPVAINGNRGNTTNYILDGANNNEPYNNLPNPLPNPDALQEFSVQTNSFNAEFGRQAGGVVNAVTKSGTNALHGSAFEFVRNQDLNAANWFAPIVDGQKQGDGLKRNQFGGTVGGPVFIPKLYNGKNKSFFFFSFQETTLRQSPVQSSIVVGTAAERSGNFSQLATQLVDPITHVPLPGNIIPASLLNPVSQYVLSKVPVPAVGDTITIAPPNRNNDSQVLVRGDHRFGDRNTLMGRYFRSWTETPSYLNPANYLDYTMGGYWLSETISVSDTHLISPSMTNQALFSVSRNHSVFVPKPPDKSLPDLGVQMFNLPDIGWSFFLRGYFFLGVGGGNQFLRDEYQGLDTVRWTHGKHQLSFGGEYEHASNNTQDSVESRGSWNFNPSAPFTGDALADFMTGHFSDMAQGLGSSQQVRVQRVASFFDDTIKVHRRLTLDLGMRWEPFFPYTDKLKKLAVWRPGVQSSVYVNAPRGVLFVGDPGLPEGLVPTVWHNFAPRVGLAWDLFGDGKTAIRAGYGVFYDAPNLLNMINQPTNAPFSPLVDTFGNAVNSLSNPYAGTVDPFKGGPTTPSRNVVFPQYSSFFLDAPDYRNPYVQAWNATIERQLPSNFVVRVSYAGSKGTRLVQVRELNPATYAVGATTATTNNRRPYAPAMGTTALLGSTGNSTFDSLQLTAERRFAHGFSILTNYQFSKSLDDGFNNGFAIYGGDPRNHHLDKGISDFNRPQVFNFSGIWEVPFRPTARWLNTALGGWNLNAVVTARSGQPLTIYSGVDNALSGIGFQRADLIGNPYIAGPRTNQQLVNEYMNTAAFAPNALNTYGNLARNTFASPGFATADLGLVKTFPVTERVRAMFRFEVFNSLNRINFGTPDTTLNSGIFMRITSAGDPRILQLALRLVW
jgi:Carboxypeptidase regulatory-like domain/TonB-dependent Receptor Plug Domain